MSDDLETEVLAIRGLVREVEDRVDAIEGPIGEIGRLVQDLVATKKSTGPDVFAWTDVDPGQAQDLWTDLLGWIQNQLCARYPAAVKALRPCWWEHTDVVDALTACWLLWCWTFRGPDATPSDAADWHRSYLPALIEQVKNGLASCSRQHEPDTAAHDVMASAPTTLS